MKLDWQHPWFELISKIEGLPSSLSDKVADSLNALSDATDHIRFVSQDALPEAEAYEAFIYRTHQVPTRNNAHDFFNGLIWHAMPRTKRMLNALQAEQIAAHGVRATRGSVRDAATLFDENGAVLVTQSQPLMEAWRARDWQRLFVELRDAWCEGAAQRAKLYIFGHATLEKLLTPYKAITTHTLWLDAPHDISLEAMDALLSQSPARIAAKDWQPLPIMGTPGWWPRELGVQDAAFYADSLVFRR